MIRNHWSSFGSVVISVMLSESRIFRCHELPDWQRWVWVLWAALPGAVAGVSRCWQQVATGAATLFDALSADWLAGWSLIFSSAIRVGVAAG